MQGGGYDIELNDKGRAQARATAKELKYFPITVVASSHLSRAKETADAIHAQAHPAAARSLSAGFAEMRFGEFEGVHVKGAGAHSEDIARYDSVAARIDSDPYHRWPAASSGEGESAAEVAGRASEALRHLLLAHKEAKHVAVVAHGRTNKILLAHLLRCGDITGHAGIHQGNVCINVLDYSETDGSWSEVLLSYDTHVSGLK